MRHILMGSLLLLLAACGSGSSGDDNTAEPSTPDPGTTPTTPDPEPEPQPEPEPEPPTPTPETPPASVSCSSKFSVEQAKAGGDCRPATGTYCALPEENSLSYLGSDPLPCAGVTITEYSVQAAGMQSTYLLLKGPEAPEAVYLALHYLGSRTGTFTNVVRLQELAKARRVAIIVPQSPSGLLGSNLGSSWPFRPGLEPVADYVRFLDGVVADARTRVSAPSVPLYVAGLSNGAAMAYNYACTASQPVAAFMAVAGSMNSGTESLCRAAQVPGSVIVHGTADLLNPYQGLLTLTMSVPQIHALFESLGGCTGSDGSVQLKQASSSLPVTVSYSSSCAAAKRHYLASVADGGHNWPGQAASTSELTLGLLGFKTANFDATIQGYDLMVEAAGN